MENNMDEKRQEFIERQEVQMKQKVAEQFVVCRKKKGLTQEELARKAGMSRTNVTRVENGRYNPSVEMMVRIAAALEAELEITLR